MTTSASGLADRLLEFAGYYFVTIGNFFERLFEIHFTLGALALIVLAIAALQLCYYLLLVSLPIFAAEEFLSGHHLNAGIATLLWILLLVLYYHDRHRPPGQHRSRFPWRRAPPLVGTDASGDVDKTKGVGG